MRARWMPCRVRWQVRTRFMPAALPGHGYPPNEDLDFQGKHRVIRLGDGETHAHQLFCPRCVDLIGYDLQNYSLSFS